MAFGSVFFPTGTYTVTRTERGELVKGRYTAGDTSTLEIVANLQDVTGAQLRDLPEGVRTEDVRVLFTTTELIAKSDTVDPDIVTIDGEDWRVIRVKKARVFAQRYRAYVERVPP